MRIGKTAVFHFLTQVGRSLAGFAATFAIARVLGADGVGIYAVAVGLLAWLSLPTNAINLAIEKRISERRDPEEYLGAGVGLSVLGAALLVAMILLARKPINSYVGAPISELLALLTVSRVAFGTVNRGLQGRKRVAQAGLLEAGERVGRTIAQVALLLLGWKVAGLIVGHAMSLLGAVLAGAFLFDITPRLPTRRHVSHIIEYARYSWLGSVTTRMFAWMDTIVLALFVGKDLIGIYEVSWTLASTLGLMAISIRKTLFPELSELGVDDDHERIRHYLNEAFAFMGVFVIPGLFGAAVIGSRILKIYSPEFQQGALILLILIIARLAEAYGSQFVSALNAVDRPDLAFRVNLVFVVANLGLNFGLVYLFGWYGAAVATAVSASLVLAFGYVALSEIVGRLQLPIGEIARQILASVVMFLVLLGLREYTPVNHYLTVALVGLGAIVYVITLLGLSNRMRRKTMALIPAVSPE